MRALMVEPLVIPLRGPRLKRSVRAREEES